MIPNLKFKASNNSAPIDSSWGEAQDYCNFVLFKPNWLPNNLRETSNKIRPESPHEESAHRSEYRDGNRALSIKQFLYDWAPPAYDHPCLWRNAKISTQENTPLPTPYLIGNNYLWFGLDYRRKVSATINMLRTQIEITTLEGAFNDQEIAKIVDSMNPVNGDIKNVILEMSFAELMYHQRNQIPASDVPTSYFKHTRNKKFHCFPHTLLSLSTINIAFPGKWLISNKINNYKLDSVFLFGMDSSRIDEAEYYFESLVEPGTYIRLLVTHKSGKYAIQYPPQLGDQECNSATHQLQNGLNLYHAWSKTNENGSHSLVLQANEEVINSIIKPAPWTTSSWVVDLCNSILAQRKEIWIPDSEAKKIIEKGKICPN